MAFRSNGGHIAGEDISAYVDEELSPAETSRVYAHLQACDDCRALADDMRATQTLVRSMPLVRAPREFTLGPEFEIAAARSYDAPKRSWFNFMPAVAMSAAVLLLLVFADLSSLSLGGASDSSSLAGAPSSSAGRTVQDASKAAQESANGPPPAPVAPRSTQPGQPTTGTAGGNAQGFGPTPAAQAAAAPPAGTQTPLSLPAVQAAPLATPAAGITRPAQASTPTDHATIGAADESGDNEDDGGISVLRVLELIAAVVLVISLGGLAWQRRRGA